MTSLTNLAHHIDYKKLVQEMNKTGLSVRVKNNSLLPKVIIQASEIANVIIPIGLLATAVIGTPLLGLKAYQWYRQFQNRKRDYPKATPEDTIKAYDNIQKIKAKLEKKIEIPGRPDEEKTANAFRESLLSFAEQSDKTNLAKSVRTNLFFYGPTGTGKTYSCEKIAKEAGFKVDIMPTFEELGGSGLQQFLTNPADAMHTYFKSILEKRKAGENVAILMDEADQYLGSPMRSNKIELNKFIEAADAHGIPLLLTANNPAKFEERFIRRSVPFNMMNFNNINVNEEDKYGNNIGMKNAKDIVKDAFEQAGIKAQINEGDLENIIEACVDKQSPYLDSELIKRKKEFKPVSMKAIDEFSTLIKQKAKHSVYSNENGKIDTIIIDEIVDIAGSWLNKTGEYVDPKVDSGVHAS